MCTGSIVLLGRLKVAILMVVVFSFFILFGDGIVALAGLLFW